MKRRLVLLSVVVSFVAGCTVTARLYPVQGPLSTQTPLPVYVAKVSGAFNSGEITAVLNEGEICKGRWAQVPRAKPLKGETTASDTGASSMSTEWDIVYGAGFYVAHVLGTRLYARAALTGNKGTVLNVEMYKPDDGENKTPGSIKGVAKDSKGNVFKLVF